VKNIIPFTGAQGQEPVWLAPGLHQNSLRSNRWL